MTHCAEHCQADHLIESIVGINKGCATWIRILIQDPCGFKCQQPPLPSASTLSCSTSATPPLSISSPPTSTPSITVLISSHAPPSHSSAVCHYPGGAGTYPIPPTVYAPPALSTLLVAAVLSSSEPSDDSSAPPSGSGICRSRRLCATAWVAPSIPDSSPTHSWRLPQTIFA